MDAAGTGTSDDAAAPWAGLPNAPGVYRMLDEGGRVLYLGRSADLRGRVRSYWGELRGRKHLRRMIARVARVDHTECPSEHAAALLEHELLARSKPRFNRTRGIESPVWLRLDCNPAAPRLDVVHQVIAATGTEYFGPQLGWEPARLAATALLRLYPIGYATTDLATTGRELARSRGVVAGDLPRLLASVRGVAGREPAAVRICIAALEDLRERLSEALQFEDAAAVQREIRAVNWIAQPR